MNEQETGDNDVPGKISSDIEIGGDKNGGKQEDDIEGIAALLVLTHAERRVTHNITYKQLSAEAEFVSEGTMFPGSSLDLAIETGHVLILSIDGPPRVSD